MTLVIFKDLKVTERVNKAIKAYRVKINFHSQAEFHFTKLKDTYRIGFLEAVAPFEFEYYSIVINKEKLKGPGFHFKNSFYKYSCRLVMNNAKKVLSNASVIIDGSGDRKFRRELAEYFRKQVNDADNPNRVVKVQMHDSKSDDLVQLAVEAIQTSLMRSYTGKSSKKERQRCNSGRGKENPDSIPCGERAPYGDNSSRGISFWLTRQCCR